MKKKTLFLGLVAGALLCFSNASYAQFHSESHSSSSSESSGGNAFDEGANIFDVGVGFAGGLSGATTLVSGLAYPGSSYSASSSPGFRITWDHGKNNHISYGLIFGYQSATFTDGYTESGISGFDPNTGFPIYSTESYTDKYKLSLITFAARGAYHFGGGAKFDPYIGITIGYATASFSFSSTDPNSIGGSVSGTGIALGAQVGANYYFSDHIGVFGELAFATTYSENIVNLGLSIKL
jgi:hypothetical protein